MSRAKVPCRGSRITFFFPFFFFLEKVIIHAINVIKTNKKNLKNKHPFLLALRRWGHLRRARRNGCFRRLLLQHRPQFTTAVTVTNKI